MPDEILVDQHDAIATVTIDREEKRNALNLAAWKALAHVFTELHADDALRCIVLRGAGDEAFAAGADISAFAAERDTVDKARRYGEAEMAAIRAVAGCAHPTVALIRGACVGGGLEIALACDLRIAGAASRFGIPINRLGLTMSYEELEFFLGVVGSRAALEILLEGSVFGAERALRMGLVTRVVADDDVEEEAYATARRVAEGAPLVNRWHKRFVRRLGDPTPLTPRERAEGYAAFDTEDYGVGFRAFLAKRKPDFKGR